MLTYANVLDALGDPTRRRIFESLRQGPHSVTGIAAGLPVSRPAVSQHLRVLEDAGLVTHRKDGTRRMYELDPSGLSELRAWVEAFWDDALLRFQEAAERKGRQE